MPEFAFLSKYTGIKSATFLKKILRHCCFPVIFAKFLRTLFYWTPPVSASSNFNASGITEAVIFWVRHDLLSLNFLSSNWHFCAWQAQAFRFLSTASFTFGIQFFLTKKDGNKVIPGLANFLAQTSIVITTEYPASC